MSQIQCGRIPCRWIKVIQWLISACKWRAFSFADVPGGSSSWSVRRSRISGDCMSSTISRLSFVVMSLGVRAQACRTKRQNHRRAGLLRRRLAHWAAKESVSPRPPSEDACDRCTRDPLRVGWHQRSVARDRRSHPRDPARFLFSVRGLIWRPSFP